MFFNDAVTSSKFPSSLKMANIKAVSKKEKKTTDPSVFNRLKVTYYIASSMNDSNLWSIWF